MCAALALAAATGCAEPRPGEVVLRVVTEFPEASGDSQLVARGGDTIIVRTADIILREVQLQRARVQECEEEEGERCSMVALGPTPVALPLGPDTVALAPVATVADTYSTVQLEIYRSTSERDSLFFAAHPALAGASVRVTGTYSRGGARKDFVVVSDYNEVQELVLDAPLIVASGRVSSLLLGVNVAVWFLSADGSAVVDPATAGPDGPNAAQVRDNVRQSLRATAPSSP
jgi:hypothetical protein